MSPAESRGEGLLFVCNSSQLCDGDYQRVDATFCGQIGSIIVLRHQGEVTAYRNLCVHMPRTLDCESEFIFLTRIV